VSDCAVQRDNALFIYLREVLIDAIALPLFSSKYATQRARASFYQLYQKRYTEHSKVREIFVLYVLFA
jgi:hypothetical protein